MNTLIAYEFNVVSGPPCSVLTPGVWLPIGPCTSPEGAVKEASYIAAARAEQKTGPRGGTTGPAVAWVFALRGGGKYWIASVNVQRGFRVGHATSSSEQFVRVTRVRVTPTTQHDTAANTTEAA